MLALLPLIFVLVSYLLEGRPVFSGQFYLDRYKELLFVAIAVSGRGVLDGLGEFLTNEKGHWSVVLCRLISYVLSFFLFLFVAVSAFMYGTLATKDLSNPDDPTALFVSNNIAALVISALIVSFAQRFLIALAEYLVSARGEG